MRGLRPLLLIFLLLARGGHSQTPQTFELDGARSHAIFEVKVLYLIGLHGEFGSVHGTLSVDRARDVAIVDATIDTNAVHMRNHVYENWVKSAEFFDATHFPQIHFISAEFPLQRLAQGGSIVGTLTIRGLSKSAMFEIDPAGCADPLRGACALAASGSIRRSEFGMRSRRGTLSDKVDFGLSVFVRAASP
jgi:polyisoprenoid-binding protein YceI